MLTLTNPLTIEGFSVFRDDQSSTQFYVEPGQPTIALDPGGKPIFSLIVYRRDEARIDPDSAPKEDIGGGILTFTVELTVPPEKFRAIHSKVRSIVYGDDSSDASQDVQLAYVDFFDGSVSVAVAGEGTGDADGHQFVSSAVGNGKIAGVADNRKAIMVKLTQDGAALMSQIEKLRTLPINVQYSLQFEHRLMGVTLHVWCDVTSSYTLVQSTYHEEHEESSGYLNLSSDNVRTDKVTSVVETMISNRTAGVEVTPGSSQITQDTIDSLAKFGEDMLSKQLEKVVDAKPPPADMDRTYLDNYATSVSSDLNFTLDEKMVLVQNYTPSANISNIFQRADAQNMVAFVDLRTAFFSVLKVPIRVNADFSALPISQVVVTVTFRSRRPDGVAEDRVESFDFIDGSTIQTFIAYANTLKEVSYDWTATVHYKDSQDPFVFTKSGEKSNFLVVDVGSAVVDAEGQAQGRVGGATLEAVTTDVDGLREVARLAQLLRELAEEPRVGLLLELVACHHPRAIVRKLRIQSRLAAQGGQLDPSRTVDAVVFAEAEAGCSGSRSPFSIRDQLRKLQGWAGSNHSRRGEPALLRPRQQLHPRRDARLY